MAQDYQKLRIFIASPGDVAEERERVTRVVNAMNRSGGIAERLGLTLEPLAWDTHASPDAGRPEGVILNQLNPAEWHVFIGILWTRFGTRTGKVDPATGADFKSGTEEEFKEALQYREKAGTGWPKIMFYRCLRPPDLLELDGRQYQLVQDFFLEFAADGAHPGLVKSYVKGEDFETQVRNDLERAVLDYADTLKQDYRKQPQIGSTRESVKAGDLRTIATPGMFRYFLDRSFPRIHKWLTTRMGLFKMPAEWQVLHDYLTTLYSRISADIKEKTYIELHAKEPPQNVDLYKAKRIGFSTPIQQVIKEIAGVSRGGDAQTAQISAISRKTKFVRNMVKRLMHASQPLILLGDPGTGKSLTLQQAAMLIAQRESKRVFPRICLFIRLGEFQIADDSGVESVWEYVKKHTPNHIQPYLDSLANSGRLIIFFDGMDEMSRERYNERTTALSVFAESRNERIKTLFSCRITDFTPRFQHHRLVLLPFTRSQIYQYLKRQIPEFPLTIEGREWSAKQLSKRLAQGGLPMQADNPFVLWLLCTYLQEEQEWPKSRVHLLDYYNHFNYLRKIHDASTADAPHTMNRDFLIWGHIAYEITTRNQGSAIPVSEIERFVPDEDWQAIRTGLQCGVLQESLDTQQPLIRFEHHRFQEYFTAFYLSESERERATIKWLDKLDAPRWQETIFNLVLMGSGLEALATLAGAIESDVYLLTSEPTANRSQVETFLADRVELGARILEQTQETSATFASLFSIVKDAVYWLADHGNPITRVKMLWIARIIPNIDIFRVAREALASNVSWVRQQALIITSASGQVRQGGLQEDLLLSFVSWRFVARIGGFFRIAKTLKQKAFWFVLASAFLLSITELAVGVGILVATHHTFTRYYPGSVERARQDEKKQFEEQQKEAASKNDRKKLAELQTQHERTIALDAQWVIATTASVRLLHSPWFYSIMIGTMIMSLLYCVRQVPEQHLFAFQVVGYVCLLIPFLWWPLWFGYWGVLLVELFLLLLLVLPLVVAIWAVTILIHLLTSAGFSGLVLLWSGPLVNRRALLEAMWGNWAFSSRGRWMKQTAVMAVPGISIVVLSLLSAFPWSTIRRFFLGRVAFFPLLPPPVNMALSVGVYAQIVGIPVITILARRWPGNRSKHALRLAAIWTASCVVYIVTVLSVWGLWVVKWQAVWKFIVWKVAIFSSLPDLVNVGLSTAIYVQAIVSATSAISAISTVQRRRGRPSAVFVPWTVACFAVSALVMVGWGFSRIPWSLMLKLIARYSGLFHFLPNPVNVSLSLSVYIEAAGLVVFLISMLWKPQSWQQHVKTLGLWTILAFCVTVATFVLWFIYLYADKVARLLGVILIIGFAVIAGTVFWGLFGEVFSAYILLAGRLGSARFGAQNWARSFQKLDPGLQARLLRGTTPETLSMPPSDFLVLLQELEDKIQKEPALSAYWAKRYQIEQIVRHERRG